MRNPLARNVEAMSYGEAVVAARRGAYVALVSVPPWERLNRKALDGLAADGVVTYDGREDYWVFPGGGVIKIAVRE